MQACKLVVGLMLVSTAALPTKPAHEDGRAKVTQAIADQIRKDCGISTQQFMYDDKSISFKYDGMIEREKVDCARDRTALLDSASTLTT